MQKLNQVVFLSTLVIVLILKPWSAIALNSDQLQTADLKADSSLIDISGKTITYIGHVSINQGTTKINADKIIAYTNQNNQIIKAIAYGKPAKYQTLPNNSRLPLLAEAEIIDYNAEKKQVTLIGHAKVQQDHNLLASPKIFYDAEDDAVHTYSNRHTQTSIIFKPKQILK